MNKLKNLKTIAYRIIDKLKEWWIILNNRDSCLVDAKFISALLILWHLNSATVDFITFPGANVIIRSLTVLWLVLAAYDSREFVGKVLHVFWPLVVCAVFLGIGFLTYDKALVRQDVMQMVYFVTIAVIFFYYIGERKKDNNKRITILLLAWAVDIFLSCIRSIDRLIDYPLLSRHLATGIYIYNSEGVISFSVVYGLVLLAPFLCAQIFRTQKKERLAWISATVFTFAMVVLTQFTIAILLYLLGTLIFVVYKMLRMKNGFWWILGIIVAGMIGLYSLGAIVSLNIFPSTINMRIKGLYEFLVKGSASGDAALRLQVYLQSFKAVVFNGFLGNVILNNVASGGHSEILDAIGDYGIVYFACFVYFFVKMYRFYKQHISKENMTLYNMTLALFIVVSLINTSMWACTMLIFMGAIPVLLIVVDRNANPFESAIKNRKDYYENYFHQFRAVW